MTGKFSHLIMTLKWNPYFENSSYRVTVHFKRMIFWELEKFLVSNKTK